MREPLEKDTASGPDLIRDPYIEVEYHDGESQYVFRMYHWQGEILQFQYHFNPGQVPEKLNGFLEKVGQLAWEVLPCVD